MLSVTIMVATLMVVAVAAALIIKREKEGCWL
jgi:hypothetical protein